MSFEKLEWDSADDMLESFTCLETPESIFQIEFPYGENGDIFLSKFPDNSDEWKKYEGTPCSTKAFMCRKTGKIFTGTYRFKVEHDSDYRRNGSESPFRKASYKKI